VTQSGGWAESGEASGSARSRGAGACAVNKLGRGERRPPSTIRHLSKTWARRRPGVQGAGSGGANRDPGSLRQLRRRLIQPDRQVCVDQRLTEAAQAFALHARQLGIDSRGALRRAQDAFEVLER
jgi:hypothetical protein